MTRWRIALCAATALVVACQRPETPAHPYNVLLLSLDTVRQDILGCYGYRPRYAPGLSSSPALDQFAREGVRLLDASAPSSWTLPSHISLLTGEPPLVHGVETEAWSLAPDMPTLAEVLQSHGYRTLGFYSAPYLAPHWGFDRGFDRYEGVYDASVRAASERAAAIRTQVEAAAAERDWRRYDDLKWKQVEIERDLNTTSERAVTSKEVADGVVAALDDLGRTGQPWFVFAHFFDAHCDYAPPPPYDRRFDPDYAGGVTGARCLGGPEIARPSPDIPGAVVRVVGDRDLAHIEALYAGELAWVDENVGRILRALDTHGLTDRTLVVVVADHGEEFFEHGYLGHRHNLYQESVHIPLLLRLPGVLPAGATIGGPVSLTDVMPTVLDLLGVPHRDGPGAASMLPLVRGAPGAADRSTLLRLVTMVEGEVQVGAARSIAFRQVVVQDAYRSGTLKLTRTRTWPQFPNGAPADVEPALRQEAAAQYAREEVRWTDLARFPDEAPAGDSTRFAEPAARAALARFHRDYAALLARRSRRHESSPLPENVRRSLESLGYVDATAGPVFAEPDVVLPPPPDA